MPAEKSALSHDSEAGTWQWTGAHQDSCSQCPQRNRKRYILNSNRRTSANCIVRDVSLHYAVLSGVQTFAFSPVSMPLPGEHYLDTRGSSRAELCNPETAPTRTLVLGKYLLDVPLYEVSQQVFHRILNTLIILRLQNP